MSLWRDKLVVTTVDFLGLSGPYLGPSVFALNYNQMVSGEDLTDIFYSPWNAETPLFLAADVEYVSIISTSPADDLEIVPLTFRPFFAYQWL